MGTNSAPFVTDLFLFCYERDFMMSVSDDRQAGIIDAFNTTSRYLDGILNINNVYLDNMVSKIYPSELKLNEANASDTEAAFLDLHLSISNVLFRPKFMFQGGTSLVDLFLLFVFPVCHVFLSVHCSPVVTCWKRADLLAPVCVMFYCVFVTFPCCILGQVWCMSVPIPDLCLLSHFNYA